MLKYCLRKWEANKGILEKRLRTDVSLNSCEYDYLIKLVVECILNQGDDGITWNAKNITVVDNGDYQGTQLFLIPLSSYQPSEYDYLMTFVDYGSCSGCDALMAIQDWKNGRLNEGQVKDFMTLCKDLVSNIIKPYNHGWRYKEGFESLDGDI